MSDIGNIPKKCRGCDKKTTTRQREWMCPEVHKKLGGLYIPPCEHPFILTDEQLEEKVKGYNTEILEIEKLIRQNKESIQREQSLIEDERRFIREIEEEKDPYTRELSDRERVIPLATEEMIERGIRIKSIEFREYPIKGKNPKRHLVILFKTKSGEEFGRNIEMFTAGHSCLKGLGIPNDPYKRHHVIDNLHVVDPVLDRLRESFEGWMLCKKGN